MHFSFVFFFFHEWLQSFGPLPRRMGRHEWCHLIKGTRRGNWACQSVAKLIHLTLVKACMAARCSPIGRKNANKSAKNICIKSKLGQMMYNTLIYKKIKNVLGIFSRQQVVMTVILKKYHLYCQHRAAAAHCILHVLEHTNFDWFSKFFV